MLSNLFFLLKLFTFNHYLQRIHKTMEVLRNFSNVVSTFAENGRSKVKVWLDSQNLKTVYHKKMRPKREGPFPITKVLGPVTYRLQLPATWRIHIVFHAALLRPYKENEVYGENYTEPPPELVEGEEVYEVETILSHRRRGREYQYFIKWQGCPISDVSWKPEQMFSDDGDILRQYKHRHHL